MSRMIAEASGKQLTGLSQSQIFELVCSLILRAKKEDMLALAALLGEAIPELAPLIGFDQRSPHHAYDLYTHVAHVVAGVPKELTLRWAALLHDIGKIPTFTRDETGRGHFYGHAPAGAEMADQILRRMKAPDALRQRTVFLIANHMRKLEPESLAGELEKYGPEALEQLLFLQEADMSSKGMGELPEMAQFAILRKELTRLREEETQ